ncbi:ABC transporter substrate-binding protein [Corynebacterium sp. ES2775-CONJ]|uniref:ABC transporter substrate-binding protein n=1 Tax=Corynebacterium sp. ES2775-CONJ TaxID=2974029 RepID=UPI00216A19DB|nr:ABC transporter substrate-binding protein [Corynebacterium sp. ES2775-CONJ]MCS4490555.1 ABC transporter substrate-binding protein [Corynebacterium sp. ES2775-CONJ]
MSNNTRIALASIAGAGIFLSGCSAGSTASQSVHEQLSDSNAVTVGVSAAPASLDFTTTGGAAIPQALMGNIYEGLVRINQEGDIEPLLAQSWDKSPDGTEYIFYLREGVTFSNGDSFNAETARFSIERVLGDAWSNGLKKQMDVVDSVEVIDPLTLRVTLKRPSNTWLWAMGTLVGAMMSPNGVGNLAEEPVGTGPYTLDRWSVGTSLSLDAREDYWGDPPKNSRAVFRYFTDAIALTNAVRSNNIDAAIGIQSPELLDSLRADKNLSVEVGTTNGEALLSMNNARAPFNDIRVRQAVMYGIDRQAVIDTTWEGYGTDTGGTPVAPTDPWYTGTSSYHYDLEKAQALMKEANAQGTPITISVPSLPYAQAASELLYSQLTDIGFKVTIESTEFPAVWLAKVYKAKDYDMSLIAHVEPRDIPNIFGNPDYYLGYNDKKVQNLLEAADQAPATEYPSMMKDVVAEIMAQAPADTLYNLPLVVVTRQGVCGIPINSVADGLLLADISTQGDQACE